MRAPIIAPLLAKVAQDFWQRAGGQAQWPLDLDEAVVFAFPLTVVALPDLHTGQIEHWLEERRTAHRFPCASRHLHGCLVVDRGAGFIFIDQQDDEAERRFTVAHELAHFLIDYWLVRQRVVEALGPGIRDVLDGLRPPTVEERFQSILSEVPLKPYTHLLEKEGTGSFLRSNVWTAENRADRLGLELMAPAEHVCTELRSAGDTDNYFICQTKARKLLLKKYGLPETAADVYARNVARDITGGPSILESWGLE